MDRKPVKKHHFYIPIAVAVVSTLAVLIGIVNYWFGISRSEVMWFCERARDGFIKQPANTWSNLGFIFTGIYIGWMSYKDDFRTANWMTRSSFYPLLFASVVVFLGPGSMAMHASDGYWGGFLDLLSMYCISTFIFVYALMRLLGWSIRTFLWVFVPLVVISAIVFLSPINVTGGLLNISEYIFGAELILAFPMEAVIRHRKRTGSKIFRGVASVVTMLIALLIWSLSLSSESWFCNPDSLIQGHAIWHILNAISALFLFFYYVSEDDPEFV